MQGQPYTEENYVNKVKEVYPDQAEEVLKLYPYSTPKGNRNVCNGIGIRQIYCLQYMEVV